MHNDSVWSQVQGSLREKLGAQSWEIWIRPIQLAAITADGVQLEVPNRYYRDWVQHNYGAALSAELAEVIGHPVHPVARKSGFGGKARTSRDTLK